MTGKSHFVNKLSVTVLLVVMLCFSVQAVVVKEGKNIKLVENDLFELKVSPEVSKTVEGSCDNYGHCEHTIDLTNLKVDDLKIDDVKYYFPDDAYNIKLYKGNWKLMMLWKEEYAMQTMIMNDKCYIDFPYNTTLCFDNKDRVYPCESTTNGLCIYDGLKNVSYEDYDYDYTPMNPKSMSIKSKNVQKLKITYNVPTKSNGKWNISLVINDAEYLLDPGWNVTYKSYAWSDSFAITASSSNSSDPLTFKDIADYFKANPLSLNYSFPRTSGSNFKGNEMTENNSFYWLGRNGMSNGTDDNTTAYWNNFSVMYMVQNVSTNEYNMTSLVVGTDAYLYMYVRQNTTSFSDADEVFIKNAYTHNAIVKINSISAGSYLRSYSPENIGYGGTDKYGNTTARVVKPLAIIWNDNLSYANVNYVGTDKLRFAIKTNGTGDAKVIGLSIRNYYGSGGDTGARMEYGHFIQRNISINSSWQEFEITLRNETYMWAHNADIEYRGYFNQMRKIYFFFDGLNVDDAVWIDGVRFDISDRNPKEIKQNTYVFNSGLMITGYFKDKGFNTRFDVLETTAPIIFTSASSGDIQLGDYSYGNIQHEGGVIHFNTRPRADIGSLTLTNVVAQSIIFMNNKYDYGGYNLAGTGTICRDCTIINCMNYMSASGWTFIRGTWNGGRYFIGRGGAITVDGLTIYGTSNYPLWPSEIGNLTYRGIKVVDNTSKKNIMYTYDYSQTSNSVVGRFVNLDLSETNNAYYRMNNQYTSWSTSLYLGFSFASTITDADGVLLENATVALYDRNDSLIFSILSNSTGQISSQDVMYYQAYGNKSLGTLKDFYFENESSNWIKYFPFTLKVTKTGYRDYQMKFMNNYSKSDALVRKGADWIIPLTIGAGSGQGTANVMGTEYAAGEEGTVYAQVLYANNTPANSAACNISIYLRNSTIVSNASMNYIYGSRGGYYYNFTVPTNISVFMTDVVCSNPEAYGSSDFHVSSWANNITTILQTVNIINVLTTEINRSQKEYFEVEMSDFGSVSAGYDYYARVWSFDSEGKPKNLSNPPTITLISSNGTVMVSGAIMNYSSTGLYNYTYNTTTSAAGGVWQSIVTANYSGSIVYLSDYWRVSSSPADVTINSITDNTIPSIVASASITNKGSGGSDFYYTYCVVNTSDNSCGGGDDTYYYTGTRWISAGENWTSSLSATVSSIGTYWFKLQAKALSETTWANASLMFTTTTEAAGIVTGGGGGSGAGAASLPGLNFTNKTINVTIVEETVPLILPVFKDNKGTIIMVTVLSVMFFFAVVDDKKKPKKKKKYDWDEYEEDKKKLAAGKQPVAAKRPN